MKGHPKPATLAQVQRNGAVAAAIRAAMKQKGLRQVDLRRSLGVNSTTISNWIGAKAAVQPNDRPKVAALLEISEASLVASALPVAPTVPSLPPKRAAVDVLSFVVSDTGQARLRMDATLPMDKAVPLLRMLLDAGLLLATKDHDE